MTQNQPMDIEIALDIFLKGFKSGAVTTAKDIWRDADPAAAVEYATKLLQITESDPAALEAIRDRIRANLNGESGDEPTRLSMRNWRDNPRLNED